MPTNDVRDEPSLSGNPTNTGIPMDPNASLAVWQEGFVDRTATPAPIGKLVRLNPVAVNLGGGSFIQSAVAAEVLLEGEAGVVILAAPATGQTGMAVKRGVCPALCTTTGTAIAVGTLLAADGAGNLTVAPTTPTPGQLVARSLGVLASSTTTPTLVNVYVGKA